MNKATIHKQQGDQEKQDKGEDLKINGCLISNGATKVCVVRALLCWAGGGPSGSSAGQGS